ncbi:MAG: PH domain-containing protein [Thermodesulfobacteriota bacterium]
MEMRMGAQPGLVDLPVNEGICFTTKKNKFSEKIKKEQTEILKRFSPFLKKVLDPGEEILIAVKATSPMTFLEQFTIGLLIVYVKRCMLILTNKRILHFPTRADFSPRQSVAQVPYGDIEDIKLSGFLTRMLKMEYRSGKKEKFYYIPSREFKKLKTLMPTLPIGIHPSAVLERHHLCPKCIGPLQKSVFSCPNCHLEFKNLKQGIKLSLLIPGGGYFFAGHPMMGVADGIVETILLIALISALVSGFASPHLAATWAAVIPIVFILSLEKMITIYDTKHFINEYIPADKDAALKF